MKTTSTMDFDRNRPVTVEYDCRGGRACKTFTDHFAARRFYTAKDKAGKSPRVIATPQESPAAR